MVMAIARPKLEGNIAVDNDRQLSFAEFGDPQAGLPQMVGTRIARLLR